MFQIKNWKIEKGVGKIAFDKLLSEAIYTVAYITTFMQILYYKGELKHECV